MQSILLHTEIMMGTDLNTVSLHIFAKVGIHNGMKSLRSKFAVARLLSST